MMPALNGPRTTDPRLCESSSCRNTTTPSIDLSGRTRPRLDELTGEHDARIGRDDDKSCQALPLKVSKPENVVASG